MHKDIKDYWIISLLDALCPKLQTFFFGACFYLVWDEDWDRMLIQASYLQNPMGFLFLIA